MKQLETAGETAIDQKDSNTWGMLCHLTALAGFVGIPFGNLLGPLVTWLIKKDEFPFADEQGKESLNFQISMTIYMAISGLLILVVVGIALIAILVLVDVVCVIIASIKASNGESYQYPLTIRFIK